MKRANLNAFDTFVRFALVWFCLVPLPLGVWEGLRLVIVALPGLFSYLFPKNTKMIVWKNHGNWDNPLKTGRLPMLRSEVL